MTTVVAASKMLELLKNALFKGLWIPVFAGMTIFTTPLIGAGLDNFQLKPKTLFTHQDRPVLFTTSVIPAKLALDSDRGAGIQSIEGFYIELIEFDPKKEKINARWQMMDNGLYGDKVSGDGIYTRRTYFKESSEGPLYFKVVDKKGVEFSELEAYPKRTLLIQQRPNLIEILKKVWGRLF